MPSFVYAIIFGLILGGIYAGTYYLNHKTPVPEGCENLKASCEGCKIISCDHNPVHEEAPKKEK